jgi:hypothetical protein
MKGKIVLVVGMLLASSGGAGAPPLREEPPIGSRLGNRLERQNPASEKESAEVAHQFARCMVAKRERDVHAYLSSSDGDSRRGARRLTGSMDCMGLNVARNDLVEGLQVNFPPDILRGMVAEHWLKKSAPQAGLLQPMPLQRIYQRPWFTNTGRNVLVDEMAACVADTNPAGIALLIRTEPYSEAERSAVAALAPSMGTCLRVGAKLGANRQALRAALAEALYQRIRNPAPADTPAATPG